MINVFQDLIKNMFYPFTTMGKRERYHREMYEFLSQATDQEHLEYLQRVWDKRNGYGAY